MTTEAQKKARNKYNAKTYKNITVSFRMDRDAEIIQFLDSCPESKTEVIKRALYEYIKSNSK